MENLTNIMKLIGSDVKTKAMSFSSLLPSSLGMDKIFSAIWEYVRYLMTTFGDFDCVCCDNNITNHADFDALGKHDVGSIQAHHWISYKEEEEIGRLRPTERSFRIKMFEQGRLLRKQKDCFRACVLSLSLSFLM